MREAGAVAQAAQDNPNITFVGVGAQDGEGAIANFVSSNGVNGFQHISDPSGSVWQDFEVTTQPFFIRVAADGSETRAGSLGGIGI